MNPSVFAQRVSTRQTCAPCSSSGRPARAATVQRQSILGDHDLHTLQTGLVGKRHAKQLHRALKMSRKRLEQCSLLCNTMSSVLQCTALTENTCESDIQTLEQELHALTHRLRRLSSPSAEVVSNISTSSNDMSSCSMTSRVEQNQAPTASIGSVASSPAIDVTLPQFSPRQYESTGRVLVCQGSKCKSKGALGVLQAVSAVVGSSEGIEVLPCKCLGKCSQGAVIRVKAEGDPRGQLYTQLDAEQVGLVLDGHFGASAALDFD